MVTPPPHYRPPACLASSALRRSRSATLNRGVDPTSAIAWMRPMLHILRSMWRVAPRYRAAGTVGRVSGAEIEDVDLAMSVTFRLGRGANGVQVAPIWFPASYWFVGCPGWRDERACSRRRDRREKFQSLYPNARKLTAC